MCVIMIADKVRPDPHMVEAGFDSNRDGAGVSWREKGKVHWKKGLNLEEVQALVAELPLPLIVHFRISTVGGAPKQLTHPFPVGKDTSNALEGSTDKGVLFHNGHWGFWAQDMKEIAIKSGTPLPTGKWSDSRAMAFCASIMGLGFLELLDQKIVVMTPKDLILFGGLWSLVNDCIVSNKGWEGRYNSLKFADMRAADTQREAEKKILSGQGEGGKSIAIMGPRHSDGCVCQECLEKVAAEEGLTGNHHTERMKIVAPIANRAGGPGPDHPLSKARAAYQEALAMIEANEWVSKNKQKRLKRELEDEEYRWNKAQQREQATKTLSENPRLMH